MAVPAHVDSSVAEALRSRIGERLRGLRLEQGLRLSDVAALAGLSEPHLSRLEHGDRWPSLQVLLSLASVFGVDAATLLGSSVESAHFATHQASASWSGGEARGSGVMTGGAVAARFDRATRLTPAACVARAEDAVSGTPEELLGMALSGSFSMALARQIEASGFEVRSVRTVADVLISSSSHGYAIHEITLICVADAPDAPEATLRELAQLAKRLCVVGRALLGVHIAVDVSKPAS